MWEWTGYLCTVALLVYHSVFDIRQRCIPVHSLAAGLAVSICWAVGRTLLGGQSWTAMFWGLVPGAAVLLLARVTRGQVGCGDGWEIMIMGCWMGWADCLLGLGIALLGIFLTGTALLLLGKVRGSSRIPFVPFLCMGAVLALLCRLTG